MRRCTRGRRRPAAMPPLRRRRDRRRERCVPSPARPPVHPEARHASVGEDRQPDMGPRPLAGDEERFALSPASDERSTSGLHSTFAPSSQRSGSTSRVAASTAALSGWFPRKCAVSMTIPRTTPRTPSRTMHQSFPAGAAGVSPIRPSICRDRCSAMDRNRRLGVEHEIFLGREELVVGEDRAAAQPRGGEIRPDREFAHRATGALGPDPGFASPLPTAARSSQELSCWRRRPCRPRSSYRRCPRAFAPPRVSRCGAGGGSAPGRRIPRGSHTTRSASSPTTIRPLRSDNPASPAGASAIQRARSAASLPSAAFRPRHRSLSFEPRDPAPRAQNRPAVSCRADRESGRRPRGRAFRRRGRARAPRDVVPRGSEART